MGKKSTEASGSLAGFLFQPDRALLHLSQLKHRGHYVSIEYIDDVGVHDKLDNVLISEQDKHSIKRSGSTFQNSSLDLWKTFSIWIDSFKEGTVNENTKFICSTNKKISQNSFLYEFPRYSLTELELKVKEILKEKTDTLKQKNKDAEVQGYDKNGIGTTLKPLIKNIKIVSENIATFKKILNNIVIEDEQTLEKLKDNFLNHIQRPLENEFSDRIYDELLGWLNERCKVLWKNDKKAKISKEEFNQKMDIINSSQTLKQLIFRAKDEIKKEIGEIDTELESIYSDSIFVKQIDSIERFKKDTFILDAINDFICYEKEEIRITEKGTITSPDFEKFTKNNEERWNQVFFSYVKQDPEKLTESEKNSLAIEIYDEIMKLKVKFKDIYEINISNKYIKTGSFHKLADVPKIGWHPDWEKLFKKDEN